MRYVSRAEDVRGVRVAREARVVVRMVRRLLLLRVAESAVVVLDAWLLEGGTKAVAGEAARRHRRMDFIMVRWWIYREEEGEATGRLMLDVVCCVIIFTWI